MDIVKNTELDNIYFIDLYAYLFIFLGGRHVPFFCIFLIKKIFKAFLIGTKL